MLAAAEACERAAAARQEAAEARARAAAARQEERRLLEEALRLPSCDVRSKLLATANAAREAAVREEAEAQRLEEKEGCAAAAARGVKRSSGLNGMLQRAVSGAKQLPRRKRVCLVIICLAVGLAVGPAVGLAVGLSIQ